MKFLHYVTIFLNLGWGTLNINGLDFINREVIYANQINNYDVVVLSDVLNLSHKINVNTIDGFLWSANINSLSNYDQQDWTLCVNGHTIDIMMFNKININQLGININDIDSIEVVASPQLINGQFSNSGMINIHTNYNKGLSGLVATSNEVGDPGPYTFVSNYASPNVEMNGALNQVAASFKKGNAYYNVGTNHLFHHMTDWAIKDRIRNVHLENDDIFLGSHPPKIENTSVYFYQNRKMQDGSLSVFLNFVNSKKDYIFLKPLGAELPAKSSYKYAAISCSKKFLPAINPTLKLIFSENQIKKYPNVFDKDLSFKLNLYQFQMTNAVQHARYNFNIGTIINLFQYHKNQYTLHRFFASIYYRLNDKIIQKLDGMVVLSNDFSIKGSIATVYKVNQQNSLNLILSYYETLSNENHNLWYQKYLDRSGVYAEYNAVEFKKNNVTTIDLIWKNKKSLNVDFELNGFVRLFKNFTIENYLYSFDVTNEFLGVESLSFHPKQSSDVIGCSLLLKSNAHQLISQSFYINIKKNFNVTDYFNITLNKIPTLFIQYYFSFSPVENLSVWAKYNYQSSAIWDEYKLISGTAYENINGVNLYYANKIDALYFIDVGVQKWLAKKQVKAEVFLRNLLNQNYNYHPVGVSFDLSLHVNFLYYPFK